MLRYVNMAVATIAESVFSIVKNLSLGIHAVSKMFDERTGLTQADALKPTGHEASCFPE